MTVTVRVSTGISVRVRVRVAVRLMVRVGVRVMRMHALASPRQWSMSWGNGTVLR